MQRKSILYLLAILALLVAMVPMGAAAQPAAPTSAAAEAIGSEQLPTARDLELILNGPAAPAAPAANPEAILFDNGPLTTHPGGGAGGADASALQGALGNTLYGYGHQLGNLNRVADDFTVPAGGWTISTITFYAYQTGSTTTTTINHVNLQIWNGPPGAGGSSVVFGDTTTNRLAGSSFSNIYRTLDTDLTNNQRPIMADVVTVNTTLPAGAYWLDWQTGGTLLSGPWAPPVTILGQTGKPGANAQQSLAGGAFVAVVDSGNGSAQDLPFVIEGTTVPPVAVTLASFDAVAQTDHVLVTWETVSELNNAGFTLYRSATEGGERTLVAFVPSQAPGGTGGAMYTFADPAVTAGETYLYWLEAMDLSGATTLHGPVSVTLQTPTAVTLGGLDTASNSPLPVHAGLPVAALLAVASLALGAAYTLRRKRS